MLIEGLALLVLWRIKTPDVPAATQPAAIPPAANPNRLSVISHYMMPPPYTNPNDSFTASTVNLNESLANSECLLIQNRPPATLHVPSNGKIIGRRASTKKRESKTEEERPKSLSSDYYERRYSSRDSDTNSIQSLRDPVNLVPLYGNTSDAFSGTTHGQVEAREPSIRPYYMNKGFGGYQAKA